MQSWGCRLFLVLAFVLEVVDAQYNQHWTWHAGTTGSPSPRWRPENTGPWRQVVGFGGSAVWLEYNCYWMPAICQNAQNYFKTPAAQDRNWPTAFTYDFNSPRGDHKVTGRRAQVCPDQKSKKPKAQQWKWTHQCPETDQPTVMRSLLSTRLGMWPHKALADPASASKDLTIQHYQPPGGGQVENSNVFYSCDEFPAAKWIEGGDGLNHAGAVALTRCAPIGKCRVSAEQTWQGTVHGQLRRHLIDTHQIKAATELDAKVAVFFFRLSNGGFLDPAARIIINDGTSESVAYQQNVPQKRRSEASGEDIFEFLNWANSVTVDELLAKPSVSVREVHVHNETSSMSVESWL